ncbi:MULTISPECIES: DivIVA domain-containing protein [Kocuria]|uniref:DivIVA domain-containing protein n=1 Tax=Kocuria TaxID=57493 RepID=UPI00257EF391|nr:MULTISPECIES: DivIVA domain-containing protein [Kocuria]MCT1723690.1 DivIVA domain-containing protein [Kocuria marina]MCT1735003.1 DivIVA domain-containing protein [Kocuria marina]
MTTQQRFDRLGERAWGYDPAQVDDFLDRLAAVMHTTTPPAPGGHADPVAGPGTVAEPVVDPADVTDPVTAEDSAASADTAGATDADREPESAEAAQRRRRLGSRQVRERVFDRVKGGYDPGAVDAHLDAVEDELFAREKAAFVAEHGARRWEEHLELLAGLLLGRLNRPHGERFRRPSSHRTLGYAAADVDVLCDRLMDALRGEPEVDPRLVRTAVFRSAQGQRSYEEQQVDAFLDRAVEFVLAMRP